MRVKKVLVFWQYFEANFSSLFLSFLLFDGIGIRTVEPYLFWELVHSSPPWTIPSWRKRIEPETSRVKKCTTNMYHSVTVKFRDRKRWHSMTKSIYIESHNCVQDQNSDKKRFRWRYFNKKKRDVLCNRTLWYTLCLGLGSP